MQETYLHAFSNKVCQLDIIINSGILLDNFAEIRDNVKKTTMETYFDAGHLSHYVTQKTEIILNSLQLGELKLYVYSALVCSNFFDSYEIFS